MGVIARACFAGLVAFAATAARADEPAVPFADAPVAVDRERGTLRVARVGPIDVRIGRFAARQSRARAVGEARARDALHAFIDDAAARRGLGPATVSALHDVVEAEARVVATRALVDAGAVVVVELSLAALAHVGAPEGFP